MYIHRDELIYLQTMLLQGSLMKTEQYENDTFNHADLLLVLQKNG